MIRQGHTLSWRLLAYGRVNHLMKDALLAAFLDHLACNPWPDRAARRINIHQCEHRTVLCRSGVGTTPSQARISHAKSCLDVLYLSAHDDLSMRRPTYAPVKLGYLHIS